MSSSRTRGASRPDGSRRPGAAPPSRRPLIVLGAVAAAVVIALLVAVIAGPGDDDPATETGREPSASSSASSDADTGSTQGEDASGIAVSGTPLAPRPDSGDDPAVGMAMPTLSGTALDGTPLTVPASDRPTMVLFVAHWCPHCQAEVPVVQRWVDDGGLPAGVDLVTVSTAVDPRRPNYPPADWLASEGWSAPVLTDGDDQAGSAAAGLTAFPFFVALDAQGRVVERVSGELSAAQLDEMASGLVGAAT